MKQLWLVFVVLLVTPAAAEKPSAPVVVQLESAVAPGGYKVTLVAVPSRAVPRLELSLAGNRVEFGATAAGQRRELVVHVPLTRGSGLDVVGSASANGRKKAAVLRLGVARAAPKRPVTRTLPDGRGVAEVR